MGYGPRMDDLTGRVAVITGGAGGIGLATATRLAREGMRVVLADHHAASLAAARRALEAAGAEVLAVETDVGELASVQALAARTLARFGAVHLVFNNAGIAFAGPMRDVTHAEWEWVMRVNLWGVIHGVEVFLPHLLEQGTWGHVVNTASFAGLVPNHGLGPYCVTKYGVVALSECLSRELRDTPVGVSVLCPMIVETGIMENSARDHPAGAPEPAPPPGAAPAPGPAAPPVQGGVLPAADVAERVLRAVQRRELYVLPHPESREFIRRRFERIDRAFGE